MGATLRERKHVQITGLMNPLHMRVLQTGFQSAERAIAERIFYVQVDGQFVRPPQPEPHVFTELLSFRKRVVGMCRHSTKWTNEQLIESYHGRKRTCCVKALESLARDPIRERDARIRAFVKFEKTDLRDKPDPAPRIISPRNARYCAELGKFLRPIEHTIYHAIDVIFGDPVVAKGLNAIQIGAMFERKWAKFKRPVAISMDMSRFDQHVSKSALKYEHGFYNLIFRDPLLRTLLYWQLHNHGTCFPGDGVLKWDVEGVRASGDMNTALGNIILMCAMVFKLIRLLIQLHPNRRIEFVDAGDDCVMIFESGEEPTREFLQAYFRRFGFTAKVETPVTEIEQISFCQCSPVWTSSGYVMVRRPDTMYKDLMMTKAAQTPGVVSKWLHEVSNCGLACYGNMPVVGAFYATINRQTAGEWQGVNFEEHRGLHFLARGMNVDRVVHDRTRASYFLAFGIMPDLQVALEGVFHNLKLGALTFSGDAEQRPPHSWVP